MREVKDVKIDAPGRDHGKVFVIREMAAIPAEKWAYRLIMALARAGADVQMIQGSGMAGLAAAGIQALPMLDFRDAEPLMDEMMSCVSIKPDPGKNPTFVRELAQNGDDGDDIEEVGTLMRLRKEILELHLRFFESGMPSTSTPDTTTTSQAS